MSSSREEVRRPPRWALVAGAVVAAVVSGVAVTLAIMSSDEPSRGPVATSPERSRSRYAVNVRVTSVESRPVGKPARKAKLRAVVRDVKATIAEMYSAGFVDRSAWHDGRFPEFFDHFGERARREARRDVEDLTLGRDATRLSAVRPDRTRVELRFLVGVGRRPVAAIANVDFSGRAFRSGQRVGRVRHRARYLLHPKRTGWVVDAYQARRRVLPAGDLELRPDDLLFVLAIGSDARPGQSVARARADSLHVIGVNPKRGVASILGIPRDSYVPIPGHGTEKVNAALFLGGPELQVRTVKALTGIPIDGYLLTAFDGFKKAVAAIGGLKVKVPYPMNDPESGARFRRGPTRLDAQEALAFSRNRHDAPGGDFGRSANQGRLIVSAFRKLRQDVARDPTTLFRWLVAAYRNIQTDLSLDEMLDLLLAALTIDGDIENRVVPGSGGTAGAASIVRLGSSARALFADLRRDGVLGGRR